MVNHSFDKISGIILKCISSGGYDGTKYFRNEMFEFNKQNESWSVIGAMKEPRAACSVSVKSFDDFERWCN